MPNLAHPVVLLGMGVCWQGGLPERAWSDTHILQFGIRKDRAGSSRRGTTLVCTGTPGTSREVPKTGLAIPYGSHCEDCVATAGWQ